MTVSTTTSKVSYTGNGSTDTFAYGFKIYLDGDLKVYSGGTLKTLTTHYTVTNAGVSSGGNVVFTSGNIPASGDKVVIERNLARTQSNDWNDYDRFPAETLEDSVDRLTFISQEIDEEVSRSIKFATTVTDVGSVEVTGTAAERANKVFGFDSAGDLSNTIEIGNFKGDWAASTSYVSRDLVKDTSTNNIFICTTSHTSSGAQPLTTNTDSAKWSLIVDAASATTSATNAAASATAAASAESNALSYKNSAETAKTASETAQAASETAKTASETAQAAAEASYDLFDDRFLGAKSTSGGNPTVDNDGNALVDGALFFDTTNNVMMVFNLGTTTWLRTTPTSTDQGHITTVSGISANVTSVAGISSDVTAVAGKATEIGRLGTADAVADMNTLGTADVVSDMNTLATADIVNDMNVLGTSTNVTNMNTLAAISSDITTAATNEASINRYSSEYTIASSAPGSPSSGDLWYDSSSTNQLKYYNGTSWVAIAPGITSEDDPAAAAMALALGS